MVDLQQFCSVPNYNFSRPSTESPYSRSEWSFATDGCILVRVPRRADVGERSGAPKSQEAEQLISVDVPEHLPTFSVPPPEECSECKGYGRVRPHRGICDGYNGCKKCNYTGTWPDKLGSDRDGANCPKCMGRRTVWPERSGVKLTQKMAIAPRYYLMLASLPGCEVSLHSDGHLPFRFDGGDGVLMPLRLGPVDLARPLGFWSRELEDA